MVKWKNKMYAIIIRIMVFGPNAFVERFARLIDLLRTDAATYLGMVRPMIQTIVQVMITDPRERGITVGSILRVQVGKAIEAITQQIGSEGVWSNEDLLRKLRRGTAQNGVGLTGGVHWMIARVLRVLCRDLNPDGPQIIPAQDWNVRLTREQRNQLFEDIDPLLRLEI
jgi:hypothetical protein